MPRGEQKTGRKDVDSASVEWRKAGHLLETTGIVSSKTTLVVKSESVRGVQASRGKTQTEKEENHNKAKADQLPKFPLVERRGTARTRRGLRVKNRGTTEQKPYAGQVARKDVKSNTGEN